jgi:hypothetical protein
MTEILTNTNLNIKDNDITKTIKKKGRPFQNYTAEEQEARNLKKVKGKPGRKAKIYTEAEILTKLEHFREYQRNYQKGKYIKKEKTNDEIIKNHSYSKQFKTFDEKLVSSM